MHIYNYFFYFICYKSVFQKKVLLFLVVGAFVPMIGFSYLNLSGKVKEYRKPMGSEAERTL